MNKKPPNPQQGQAMIEYILVTLFCVIALVVAVGDGANIEQLEAAFTRFFRAYSYAISVAPQPHP